MIIMLKYTNSGKNMERKIKVVSQINEINGGYQIVLPTPYSVGPINVYLIKGDVLTLIDTGPKTKETWNAFCALLAELAIKPDDIEQVILTHHHPDHVGLLDYMPNQKRILGHWKNNPWINRTEEFLNHYDTFFRQFFKELGVEEWMHTAVINKMKATLDYACSNKRVTCELNEGDKVPGLAEWEVLETPGHAGSHIVLYREKDGVMIAGDLIIEHISPNPLIEPPYKGESTRAKSLLQFNESLEKCLDLDLNFVLSGHGNNIKNAHSLIGMRKEKQEERANRVFAWLKEEPLTAYDISKKLFPALYKKQLALTMSATVGQLDYLEANDVIEIDKTQEIWRFLARS